MPDRTNQEIQDYNLYEMTWLELAAPIIKATGTYLSAFNSGVSLRDGNHHDDVILPIWFLRAFNAWFAEKGL